MIFKEAAQFVIPYGDNAGLAIEDVAMDDSGLKSLDRFLGWVENKKPGTDFHTALKTYLSDPSIKKDLQAL